MRLPFGFGRRSGSGDGATGGEGPLGATPGPADSAAGSASSPSVPANSSSSASGGPAAWAGLPPIQRTAGSMPLIAAPGDFAGSLPGTTGLPPIVEPLGHEVSPLATPGLVVARTRAVEASSGGSLPAPAVQRRAQATGSPDETTSLAAPPLEHAGSAPGASPSVDAASTVPAGHPAPVRSLPTVSRLTIRMPDRPLTSAAGVATAARVQRSTAAPAAPGSQSQAAGVPAAPARGMRRVATAAAPVVARSTATGVPSPSPATAPRAGADPSPAPARSGLGAPLAALPTTARPASTSAAGSDPAGPGSVLPLAASAIRAVQRAGAEAAEAPRHDGVGGAEPAAAHGLTPRLPVLPVARPSRVGSPPAEPAIATAQRLPAPQPHGGPAIRPVLAARPIQPALRLQRTVDGAAGTGEDASLPSPWWSPAEPGTTGAASSARDASPGPAAVDGGPQGLPGTRPSLGAGSSGAPGRAAIAATPAAGRPSLQRLSIAPPVGGLPVVRPAVLAARAAEATAATPATTAAATQSAATSNTPPAPVVQLFPAAGHVQGPSPATVQRAEGGGSLATVGDQGDQGRRPSDSELEELAQALFGRIRTRLRSELLHDREAKGLTFDHV